MLRFSITENSFLFTYHLITFYYLISSITLRDESSKTAPRPECTALEITAVDTTTETSAPPRRPPPESFSRSVTTRGPARPSPPTSSAHQDRVPPIVKCICWNRCILPVSASTNQAYSRAKCLFVCFSGRVVSISVSSHNPSWSAQMKWPKWSKLFSWLGGCLPCSNCSTNVSCCGNAMIINYGGQESEMQATPSTPAPLPDLISV
jgi:hypothetical protein